MNFDLLKKRWAEQVSEQKNLARQRQLALTNKGPAIFKKYSIKKAILFGSVLKERCTPRSDIDLFLTPLNDRDFWKIRHELEEATNCSVDVYSQSDDSQFVDKIIARGKTIYES